MPRVIIGGGGIGGLTAALALATVGIEVTVVERRPVFGEIGAGLQLAPNATRILGRMGLLEPLRASAIASRAVRIRRGRDAADLVRMSLKDAERRYGAPFLTIHRADLHRTLVEQVSAAASIQIVRGTTVVSVDANQAGVVIGMEGAAGVFTEAADGFIDASGARGAGPRPAPLRDSGRVAWRALVPASAVHAEFAAPETNLWVATRAHVVHYPLRGASLINVVAITESDGPPRGDIDFWSEPGDRDSLMRAFGDWHPTVARLLDAAPDWRRWPLFDRRDTAPWTVGAITRVGDAAHPMLPFLAQGASQAVEDADALARAFDQGRVRDAAQAFARYETTRRARAERVQRASRRQGDVYHLGRPASDARDLALRLLGGRRALASLDWLYGSGPLADSS